MDPFARVVVTSVTCFDFFSSPRCYRVPIFSDLFLKGLEDLVSHVQWPEFFNLLCKCCDFVKRLETTADAHLKWRKKIGVDG